MEDSSEEKESVVVGNIVSFETIQTEYSQSAGFTAGIEHIKRKYTAMRRVKGDGNWYVLFHHF